MKSTAPAGFARVDSLLLRHRAALLDGLRSAVDGAHVGYAAYMRYHFGWEDASGEAATTGAGKMLRPALCLLACEAAGGDPARAMPAGIALELVHNFTLIHDDIEDNSDTRHGRPTLWKMAGIAQAINTGDGMFVLAQRTLLRLAEAGVSASAVLAAARALDDACVALCDGQYADIGFEQTETVTAREYEAMVSGKTAALLGASAEIGALAADADATTAQAFRDCGRNLGMAFQVRDDVLGIWGDHETTGKPVADDIRSRKKSFPVVLALDKLPAADRARMKEIYSHRRMGSTDVAEVLRLLDLAEARQASADAARGWADRALASIDRLNIEPERHADIEALAAFVVDRTA